MYKVGIIGCGRIASGFEDEKGIKEHPCTHAGVYSLNPKTKITCACDPDGGKLRNFSKRWGVDHLYQEYKEMLKQERIDILSVCTPPSTHSRIVMDAARAGVKSIFCEKPIAASLPEAEKMVAACQKYGSHLTINHSRRWNENYAKLRGKLLNNKFGRIVKVTGFYSSGLHVIGTHMIDLLVYLCGKIDKVIGVKEDTGGIKSLWYSENFSPKDPPFDAVLWFKNGAVGHLVSSCKTSYPFFDLDILAAKGRIIIKELGYNQDLLIELYETEKKARPELKLKGKMTSVGHPMVSFLSIKDIISSREKKKPTASTGEDALEVMKTMEALRISASKNNLKTKV